MLTTTFKMLAMGQNFVFSKAMGFTKLLLFHILQLIVLKVNTILLHWRTVTMPLNMIMQFVPKYPNWLQK